MFGSVLISTIEEHVVIPDPTRIPDYMTTLTLKLQSIAARAAADVPTMECESARANGTAGDREQVQPLCQDDRNEAGKE